MIILVVLLLFVIFKAAMLAGTTLRKHQGRSNRAPVKRRMTAGDDPVDQAGQQVCAWTVLDDLQLNRLLKDSPPH